MENWILIRELALLRAEELAQRAEQKGKARAAVERAGFGPGPLQSKAAGRWLLPFRRPRRVPE